LKERCRSLYSEIPLSIILRVFRSLRNLLQKKASTEKEKNAHFDFESFCVQKHHLKMMQKVDESSTAAIF
jgi:hypothetical protein